MSSLRVTARIFRCNEMGFAQRPHGARAHVFQVPDRGGDEIQGAHAIIKPQMKSDENGQEWEHMSQLVYTLPNPARTNESENY